LNEPEMNVNKIITIVAMSIVVVCMMASRAEAQSNSLPLGTLTVAPDPVPCSTVLNGLAFPSWNELPYGHDQ
jgi:hypothetical protein